MWDLMWLRLMCRILRFMCFDVADRRALCAPPFRCPGPTPVAALHAVGRPVREGRRGAGGGAGAGAGRAS
jgi:hypothetical protein